MSLISKALKKVQEARLNYQKNKPENVVYLADAPQSWPRTALMGLWIVCTLGALLTSVMAIKLSLTSSESKQVQVTSLERTVKNQEKRIDDFITIVNKNQKFTDSQIRELNTRISERYSNLKDAILDDKEEISSLNRRINDMDQKIERISAEETKAKDLTVPPSGT